RLVLGRLQRRPRHLVQKSDVSGEQSIGLVVVIKLYGGEPVLRGMEDACIPGLLRQRMNRDARNLARRELLRVGATHLLHVYTCDRQIHLSPYGRKGRN